MNVGDYVCNTYLPHQVGTITRLRSGFVEVRLVHGGLVSWSIDEIELIDRQAFYRASA